MRDQSFLRHAVLYGLSSALVQAGGFLLVPLYTRCLSKADFGALEVLGRCAEMAGTLLLVGGLRQGLLACYQQSETDRERDRVFSAAMILVVGIALLVGTAVMALVGPICGLFQQESGPATSVSLLRLAFLAVLLEPLALMPLALLQARVESATFVAVTASQFLLRVALCVVLTVCLQWGVAGVLTASALTAGLFGVGLSLRELLRGGTWPSRKHLADLLWFALPFLPAGLCGFLLHYGDRFFLLYWHGKEEVGVYGLGYKVALAVSTFSLAPLHMVWSARMFKAAQAPDAPRVFGRAFTRMLAAFVLVGLAACMFQEEAARVLGGRAYAGAACVVTPVVLAGLFLSAATLMDAGFYVRRRTGLKLGITLSATAVMVVLYWVLIPSCGAMGAALATLGGFAFMAVCTWRTAQRIFPVEYEWGRVGELVALAAGLWGVSRLLPGGAWTVAAKGGLWLLWPLLVWVCGLLSAEEKEYVQGAARRALSWLWPGRRRPVFVRRHSSSPARSAGAGTVLQVRSASAGTVPAPALRAGDELPRRTKSSGCVAGPASVSDLTE